MQIADYLLKKPSSPCFSIRNPKSAIVKTYPKNVDQGSRQGAVRQKSAAYTLVCEHFKVASRKNKGL